MMRAILMLGLLVATPVYAEAIDLKKGQAFLAPEAGAFVTAKDAEIILRRQRECKETEERLERAIVEADARPGYGGTALAWTGGLALLGGLALGLLIAK